MCCVLCVVCCVCVARCMLTLHGSMRSHCFGRPSQWLSEDVELLAADLSSHTGPDVPTKLSLFCKSAAALQLAKNDPDAVSLHRVAASCWQAWCLQSGQYRRAQSLSVQVRQSCFTRRWLQLRCIVDDRLCSARSHRWRRQCLAPLRRCRLALPWRTRWQQWATRSVLVLSCCNSCHNALSPCVGSSTSRS